jgi:hypothetical protein
VNDGKGHAPDSTPTACAGGGGEPAPSRSGSGGESPPVDPTLLVTVNDASDLVLPRGWPAIVLVRVLPPRFLDDSPGVEPFSIAAPSGAWAAALDLTVRDATGATASWPSERFPQEGQVLDLDAVSAGIAVFLLAPETTASLPTGDYEIGAVLDTTAFGGGWQGRVEAETVTVHVQDPPVPLPGPDEEERRLLVSLWRFLRGEADTAQAELDGVLAADPRSPGALAMRAFFLDGEGKGDEALSAYGEAIDAHREASPEAPEPPFLLLERHLALLAERLVGSPPVGDNFLRGDPNGDRSVDLSDAVSIISYLFLGGSIPGGCLKSADVDDDGAVEITDGIYLLDFLFLDGQAIPAPYPACGPDPTSDGLPCPASPSCGR